MDYKLTEAINSRKCSITKIDKGEMHHIAFTTGAKRCLKGL